VGDEQSYGTNVWAELDAMGDGVSGKRLDRTPDCPLVAAVWQLEPAAEPGPYHLHHGTDEYLVVLRGRPTLRTPGGERKLAEGDAVQFPRGLAGAHQVRNDTDEPVRVVIFAYHGTPDVIEYLDGGVTIAGARTPSADGEPLFRRFPAE
jgi:uncharacterized cupin superfamily protein